MRFIDNIHNIDPDPRLIPTDTFEGRAQRIAKRVVDNTLARAKKLIASQQYKVYGTYKELKITIPCIQYSFYSGDSHDFVSPEYYKHSDDEVEHYNVKTPGEGQYLAKLIADQLISEGFKCKINKAEDSGSFHPAGKRFSTQHWKRVTFTFEVSIQWK